MHSYIRNPRVSDTTGFPYSKKKNEIEQFHSPPSFTSARIPYGTKWRFLECIVPQEFSAKNFCLIWSSIFTKTLTEPGHAC